MLIHGDKLRWLFWLRWKMFLRDFTRSSSRVSVIIGRIFLLFFMLVVGGGIALLSFLAYRFLQPPANSEALFVVLMGIYLLWIVLPLMEYSINEGLDLSKLSLFPLTRAELMASLVFSTLLDVPVVGLFLVFAAVVAGWAFSLPLALVALLAMLIFYVQLVGISQLVLALMMRTLQTRRFRDVMTIVLVVLISSSGLLCQLLARGLTASGFVEALRNAAFSPYLQWLPPGMAARAIQQASVGNWGMSFVWLAALLAISILVLYLWQIVVERALSTPESASPAVQHVRRRAPALVATDSTASTNLLRRLLPPQVVALMVKDLKYFRRDPQLQALLVQSLISIVLMSGYVLLIGFQSSNSGRFLSFIGPWAVMIAPAFVLLSLYTLSYNVLGLERQSLTALFLFPIEPKYILWAKNLTVFLLGAVEITLLILLSATLSHSWDLVLPAFAIGLAAIAVILGCGNFTSVFFPQRMRQAFRGFQSSANLSAEGGCLRALMSMLSFYAMAIVLLPVELALILPYVFHVQWIWIISIPASLAYGAACYFAVTALVAPRILNKTPEILAATTRE